MAASALEEREGTRTYIRNISG